jgi:HK97 family phage prohead protease
MEVQRARELYALICQGALDGLSIGYKALDSTGGRRGSCRHLRILDLWEISIVTFPMLTQARITSCKRQMPSSSGNLLADRIRQAAMALL